MSSIESAFYSYMNFDTDQAVHLREDYIKYFSESQNILELAPGDGAFLLSLQEKGKNVVGVDNDPGMVERARQRGLEIIEDDIINFLQKSPGKFDGIYASHIIEHLDCEILVELLSLCHNTLMENGVLMIVTPNPASIFTQLHEFWRDPTHKRPYTLDLICFLFEYCGFEVIESGGNSNFQVEPHQLLLSDRASAKARISERPNQRHHTEEVTASSMNRVPAWLDQVIFWVRRWIVGKSFVELHKQVVGLEGAVRHNANATQQFMEQLYPPNEIFVVGKVKQN